MSDDDVPARSQKGKEILAHAFSSEYCVIEFTVTDNDEMMVADITDHLRQLERMHLDNDPAEPMDVRTGVEES